MTMPHLMNCPHKCGSWCLACVKELGEENINLHDKLSKISDIINKYADWAESDGDGSLFPESLTEINRVLDPELDAILTKKENKEREEYLERVRVYNASRNKFDNPPTGVPCSG